MLHKKIGGFAYTKINGAKNRSLILTLAFFVLNFAIACFSCGPFPDTRQSESLDLSPPLFSGAKNSPGGALYLEFDEEVFLVDGSLLIQPELIEASARSLGNTIMVEAVNQVPGMEYSLEAVIQDNRKNTANVLIGFYGYNPSVPRLLINEFITNGSDSHPDLIEIKVIRGGNMAGVAIYEGTRGYWDSRLIFPSFDVITGDFLLVHFRPEGIPSEVNETGSKAESGGLDASPFAYDFWVSLADGLSGNNGTLTLYSSPSGEIMDGVLYSNRTRDSDTAYLGFGTDKAKRWALAIAKDGGWKTTEASVIPEDGINPDLSTSTRSICRDKSGTDTDTKNDWHIVPVKKSSFGADNSEEVYQQ